MNISFSRQQKEVFAAITVEPHCSRRISNPFNPVSWAVSETRGLWYRLNLDPVVMRLVTSTNLRRALRRNRSTETSEPRREVFAAATAEGRPKLSSNQTSSTIEGRKSINSDSVVYLSAAHHWKILRNTLEDLPWELIRETSRQVPTSLKLFTLPSNDSFTVLEVPRW